MSAFDNCLDNHVVVKRIHGDSEEALKLGITGTPTFLLGVADGSEGVRVSRRIEGAQPFAVFQLAVETLLENPQK